MPFYNVAYTIFVNSEEGLDGAFESCSNAYCCTSMVRISNAKITRHLGRYADIKHTLRSQVVFFFQECNVNM